MLPFTAEVFFRFVGQYNESIWPAPLLGWLCCIAMAALAFRAGATSGRIIGALLVGVWAWVGIVFHYLHFAGIFFGAPVFAALFLLQAILLAWSGVFRGRAFVLRAGPVGGAGLGLIGFALFCWPLIDWLSAGDWRHVRLAGTTPSPTIVFTAGILLLVKGRVPLHLAMIPLVCSALGGAGAWVLGMPEALSLPLAGVGSFVILIWKNRRERTGCAVA